MEREELIWLTGLIEGEGTFYVNIPLRDGGFTVLPCFKVTLSEKDKKTIEFIKKTLGFGRVEFKSSEIWKRKGMTNVQSQYSYTITSLNDAQKFIEIFDENLFRSSKKENYLLWKKVIDLLKDYKHLTYDGFATICEIRDKMNLKQKRKNYKNKDWFLKHFENNKKLFSENNIERRKKTSASIRRLNKIREQFS